jgi:hypothetical protein
MVVCRRHGFDRDLVEMKKIIASTVLMAVVSLCTFAGAQSVSKSPAQQKFDSAVKEFEVAFAKAKPAKLVLSGRIVSVSDVPGLATPMLELKVAEDGIALVTALKNGKPTTYRTIVPIGGITAILKNSYSAAAAVLTNLPKSFSSSWNQLQVKFLTADLKKRKSIVVKLKS